MASTNPHASRACAVPCGFTVLSLKFQTSSASRHQLCVKEHRVRARADVHRPPDRTLFVLNIPPYCSQNTVNELFSQFGLVQSVELSEKPGSVNPGNGNTNLPQFFTPAEKQCFKVGYIVFKNSSSVAAAMAHSTDSALIITTPDRPVQTGLKKWIHEYTQSFVKTDIMQKAVDDFMQQYDKSKAEEAERLQKEAEQQQEDEDGWIKVTKGGRGAKVRTHSEAANERTLQKENNKKKRKELLNFYTWQHRNTQREHIAELRKKFEEDKQRIALLRAQRKFRPY